ncbi:hypothetical protein [Streptomyces lydicus]|uniref:Uncharacterized protein n=1 Tax=Streptomyces lydicus TaxID=47763 RepID=A0A1D7VVB3_9ACTN|nr:hypothetical protein [Streptomyces lydicus]AOP50697.1 hypothetical protein SL103_34595 [Streptomyces lydicus]
MNGTGTPPERPVEERLRRAFAARADSIGIRDLRPAAPPGPPPRRGLPALLSGPWLRRFGLPLAVAAAAAAAVLGRLAATPDDPAPRPVPPATSPSPLGPSPSPAPTGPAARPSPRTPPTHPGRATDPTGSRSPGTVPGRTPRSTPSATPTLPGTGRTGGRPPETTGPPASPSPTSTPGSSNPRGPGAD